MGVALMAFDKQDALLELRQLAVSPALDRFDRADNVLLRLIDDEHVADAFRMVIRRGCPECLGGWSETGGNPPFVPDHALDCSRFR